MIIILRLFLSFIFVYIYNKIINKNEKIIINNSNKH